MTKREMDSLSMGSEVWLSLPSLSRPLRGTCFPACLANPDSKAKWGVVCGSKRLKFKLTWCPRSDWEFMRRASIDNPED